MKHFSTLLLIIAVMLSTSLMAAEPQETAPKEKEDAAKTDDAGKPADVSKIFYILGRQIGTSLKKLDTDLQNAEMGSIDMDAFIKGLKSCFSEEEPLISDKDSQKIRQEFFQKLREKQTALRDKQAKDNLKKAEEFMAENKDKEGIVTTESGLQYQVIKEGEGNKPNPTDKVTVHYRGTLLDGTEFDSSHKRGKPATFPVNGVIKGWQEALVLMTPGSKYKLFIPPEIGYGERGSGQRIPPNSVLIFDIELLKVEKAAPKPPASSRTSKRPPVRSRISPK